MTITANISDPTVVTYTKSLHQYDKNVNLEFVGMELPEEFKIVFSNNKDGGLSVECEGNSSSVIIPNELLLTGQYVYVWIRTVVNDAGLIIKSTLASVVIPVVPRPVPIPVNYYGNDGSFNYRVDADEENLTFSGAVNADDNNDPSGQP